MRASPVHARACVAAVCFPCTPLLALTRLLLPPPPRPTPRARRPRAPHHAGSTVRFLLGALEKAGCPVDRSFFKVETCEQQVVGGFRPPDGARVPAAAAAAAAAA